MLYGKTFIASLYLDEVVVIERRTEIPERVTRDDQTIGHSGLCALRRTYPEKKQNDSRTAKYLPHHRRDYTCLISEDRLAVLHTHLNRPMLGSLTELMTVSRAMRIDNKVINSKESANNCLYRFFDSVGRAGFLAAGLAPVIFRALSTA